MRLPFLQVDADFLATGAGDLAEVLRNSSGSRAEVAAYSEADAGWAMVRLWGWSVSKASTADALGVLDSGDLRLLAERAAGWKGEAGAFLAALCNPAIGLAQMDGDGTVRLGGMERYAATYRKQEADRARKSRGSRAEVARATNGTPSEVARKTQTQTQTQREEKKIPPTPQGAREPREGDPCEEHQPPATTRQPAAAVADASFVAPQVPPKPGEWTIPDAVDAVHRVVCEGAGYTWVPADDIAANSLRALCVAENLPTEQWPVEIARRFGRALVRARDRFATGKARTMRMLAVRECWKANAELPDVEVKTCDRLSGVVTVSRVKVEPWVDVVEAARRTAA